MWLIPGLFIQSLLLIRDFLQLQILQFNQQVLIWINLKYQIIVFMFTFSKDSPSK
jgi:hypothetical protein